MKIRKIAALGIILLGNRFMYADASYQETTQVTGGSMVDSLKSVSFLSKSMSNAFAPMTTTTMVHGNQKAVVAKDYTEITDLDRETITHIDTLHKTYSVVTFDQMRQAIREYAEADGAGPATGEGGAGSAAGTTAEERLENQL